MRESRVFGELVTFAADTLLDRPSDNRPAKAVMLIPGFMASDATLYPLAARLGRAGYETFFAGIWCNLDCPSRMMERLEKTLQEANRATGAKVAVIGHSLGGIYAREQARRFPNLVARAILLGAPLKHPVQNSIQPLGLLASLMQKFHSSCLAELGRPCSGCGTDLAGSPPQVPETIIYTKSDGIVDWRCCLENGHNVEAVEVRSSHCGLSVSVEAWNVIVDRLSSEPASDRSGNHGRDGGNRPNSRQKPYLRLVKRPASAA
jgi:hypothetical protein